MTKSSMTPREIVQELDKHIVGQAAAKRAVAIALRNRWRRMQVGEPLRAEITPKNILMIGPTGVGKTEIARRLARLANAPFIKVEATKFTEVGYVGREVDSIIKDLVDVAVKMTREQEMAKVRHRAMDAAEERILDELLPRPRAGAAPMGFGAPAEEPAPAPRDTDTRQRFRKMLREGQLDDRELEIELRAASPAMEIMAPPGMEELSQQLQGMFANLGGGRTRTRRLKVARGVPAADRRGSGQARQRGGTQDAGAGQRRAERHRLPRRDRQDRAPPGRGRRRRRLARRRAARPAAAGRGQHGQHQVRHGADRPHPVHRVRRLPHVEAVRPDPGAAGPLADPGRTRRAQGRGVRAASSPSRTPRCARSTPRCWRPRASRCTSTPAASGASPRSRSTSTSAPRTSAPAACTR